MIFMNNKARKNVHIVCGSDSDLSQVLATLASFSIKASIKIHVISCHRNPRDLVDFIFNRVQDGDIVIGVGSKALALPGVIDAWAYHFKKNVRVAGVALGESGSNALLAAQLSIEELPGQPVIINEITGKAYTGPEGLRKLIKLIDNGELPPSKPRKDKPTQIDIC